MSTSQNSAWNSSKPLVPTTRDRGRVLETFRQQMPTYNMQLTGELGWISDPNFLEQYYEAEWDQRKDQTTDLELKRIVENRSWSVYSAVRLNRFFTEAIRAYLDANPDVVDSRRYVREGRAAVAAEAARLLTLFDVAARTPDERETARP